VGPANIHCYNHLVSFPIPGRKKNDHEPASAVSFDREGQEWLNRIAGAIRSEPWLVTLLKLAWTAGPATLMAASLGYYLGFGKTAPLENLLFFFAYTVIFGIIGLAASIFARATYGKKRENAERDLLLVADYLPDIISTTRDLHLATLAPEVRRLEAVGLLLQRVDLDTEALALAMEEIGAPEAIAKAAAKIDIYRLAGLDSRADELVSEIAEQVQPIISAVAEWAPHVAKLLHDRLNGHAPSFNDGVPRDSNFLERVLSAMDRKDDQLMTLLDAEEVLVLACELIGGRSIPMLVFSYPGHNRLAEITDTLERRRNLYRIANTTVISRLKALVALLGDSDDLETEGATRGSDSIMMWDRARCGIDTLNEIIGQIGIHFSTAPTEERLRMLRLLGTLRSAVDLTDEMDRVVRRAGRRHTVFLRTAEKWAKELGKTEGLEMNLNTTETKRSGFQVVKKRLELTNEESLELAVRLAKVFKEWGVVSRADRLFYRHGDLHCILNAEVAKELAMEVAVALQPLVDITQPEVQRAIDASPAANLLGLERGLSARTKAAWGAAAAQEVEEDLALAAERMVGILTTHYRVTLTESAMEFLHRSYGARLDRLRLLNSHVDNRLVASRNNFQTQSPLFLLKDAEWKKTLSRARTLLKRYEYILGS
jgi:hypothetical protein